MLDAVVSMWLTFFVSLIAWYADDCVIAASSSEISVAAGSVIAACATRTIIPAHVMT